MCVAVELCEPSANLAREARALIVALRYCVQYISVSSTQEANSARLNDSMPGSSAVMDRGGIRSLAARANILHGQQIEPTMGALRCDGMVAVLAVERVRRRPLATRLAKMKQS